MSEIGVIGSGIAGLTAAYRLRQHGADVTVLEAAERPGGVIQTQQREGFLVEHGPNSLRPTPLLETLIRELGLEEERVWAHDTATRRYIVRDEEPLPIPTSLTSFLTTDLFSTSAKLGLLMEPFVSSQSRKDGDESLADFTRRRLGSEVLDYAVAPFVGGVFAGDPETLSARHSFERLVQWESEYGSLFWGGFRTSNSSQADIPSGLYSFRSGLSTLPTALADALSGSIELNAPVSEITGDGESWHVQLGTDGSPEMAFERLICTVPLYQLNHLSLDTPVDLDPLDEVYYPPLQVVALGFDRSAVKHPLDGFGLLVPPVESKYDILGTLFSSTLFPGRAPSNKVLLTTFVGGARNPDLALRGESEIQDVVERDLNELLGTTGSPVFSHHVHWKNAIPQYVQGYGRVKRTLDSLEAAHPSLAFAGNYRQGVSVGDTVASGAAAAERILTT